MFNRVHGPGSYPDGVRQPVSDSELPLELKELQEQHAVAVSPAAEAAGSDWPVSIFVPERYEEKYAYPLLIWFHDSGRNEGQLEQVISAISPQNYCGLGIQGNQALPDGDSFDWNTESLEYGAVSLRDLLSVTVRRLRRAFHIHSERIFLAGAGRGAGIALQQLAETPDWYAGAVLLSPECGMPLMETLALTTLHGKSVLWTESRNASSEHLARNVEAVQLARHAEADLHVRITDTVLDPESPDVRFVDHWLLSRLGRDAWV